MNKRHLSVMDLFLLIDEQTQEIAKLREENTKLREELQELQKLNLKKHEVNE